MRTNLLDEMGRGEMAHEAAEAQDVTLGMTALLGIFLAVVLVCAVFFGFGYSTGRTLHGAAHAPSGSSEATAQSAAADGTQAPATGSTTQALTPLTVAPPPAKPSPATAMDEVSSEGAEPLPAAERSSAAAGYTAGRTVAPSRVSSSEHDEAPSRAAAGVMVQIAAVARQGDADALARALRRSGYSAVVRTEPQDSFLHVQVGPFATREQARGMRARLQADGYNAFMKP